MLQSSGGVFWLLKIFCVFVLDLFLYSCLYLDMTFLTQSQVYFVVIVWAWVFLFYNCCYCYETLLLEELLVFFWGGGGMLTCLWFLSFSIIGCVC